MAFNDKVLEYASAQHGNPPAEEIVPVVEMATETLQADPIPSAEMAGEQAPVETPIEQAAPVTPQIEPDYNKWLEETTEGAFKDVDTLRSSLSKVKEYDTLAAQKAELEEKVKVDPFINDYVKTLNEGIKSGWTQDQIKNYHKINSVDISALSPVEAKIADMVLLGGYNENIARKIVEQEFPLNDYDEGSDERLIMEEKLRVSAKSAQENLQKYKTDISTIDNSAQAQAEQQKLEAIAAQEQYKASIKQAAPKIAEQYTGLGEIHIKEPKDGEEPVKQNFDYPAEYKAEIPAIVQNYYLQTGAEVNEESQKDLAHYIQAEYLRRNFDKLLQANTAHVEATTWEKAVNKYENRTGLPEPAQNVNTENVDAELGSFLKRVATGR